MMFACLDGHWQRCHSSTASASPSHPRFLCEWDLSRLSDTLCCTTCV